MSSARPPGPATRVRVTEVRGGACRTREDRLTTEEPLEIRLGWPGHGPAPLTVTMRTPGHDFELAAGLLFAEGLVGRGEDIATVSYCTETALEPQEQFNVVTVGLAGPPARAVQPRYAGPGAGSAACGVCGKQSIADVLDLPAARAGGPSASATISRSVLASLPERMRQSQRLFAATGGLHAAGLFTAEGDPLLVREDVGRHNAVDKAVGARLLAGQSTGVPLLCVSGRLGFELVQKAVVAGITTVAAVGAPSSLAVQLAQAAGVCTAGFVREDRFVVYTCPERLR